MTKTFTSGTLQQKTNAFKRTVAMTAVLTLMGQNFAWATCADGTQFPAGGYVIGQQPQVATANNWSPGVFTAPAQGIFVPDMSVSENNDPLQPPTNGGHNWVFDQGSTLCRVTDVGTLPARPAGPFRRIPRPSV
jgi:hypothetical protein